MRFWRITRFADRARAFSGEGARLYPGRWNPADVPVVYTSSSLSLAAFEILVHAEIRHLKLPYYCFHVDVPDKLVEEPSPHALPRDWSDLTHPASAQEFGGAWAASLRSLALLVPSIVIPEDKNAVLNPRHPAFARLKIGAPSPFRFDPRIVKRIVRKSRTTTTAAPRQRRRQAEPGRTNRKTSRRRPRRDRTGR